jgi:hypothetical protein
MFSFAVNFIVMIIVFSIIFFIMSYLNIKMNVELTFKPIYKPLLAEALAMSISNSDVGDKLVEYYAGKLSESELKNILNRVINARYLVCVESKCFGDRVKGEEVVLPFLTKGGRRVNIRVIVA